jgi:hypothetical protein
MLIGLGIITWYPQVSIGLGNAIMGGDPNAMVDEDGDGDADADSGGMPTMEEMMLEAMGGDEDDEDEEDEEDEEALEEEADDDDAAEAPDAEPEPVE